MKKLIVKILFLTLVIFVPVSAMAGVSVHVNIPLPPPIIFPGPPEVVVIPETNVYAVPDVDADIFFYSGWWWRPWEGRWYRSRYYDRGWAITGTFHLFIDIFLPDGETITAITGGEDMNGSINGSLTETFNVIGAVGKETSIGKDRIPGA
jgi:hypothetical protein